MSIELQKDEHGNEIKRGMTAYEVRRISGETLLMVIEYVETTGQLEKAERKQFQTMVYAQNALEFAETLRRAANAVLSPNSLNTVQ